MKISYIDKTGEKVMLYNTEGFLIGELDGVCGSVCGHGGDFFVVEKNDRYESVSSSGKILSTYMKDTGRLSSVEDGHIVMCEGNNFVKYNKYGIRRESVSKRSEKARGALRPTISNVCSKGITALIILNAIAAGAMTYLADDSVEERILNIFCDVSIVIFVIEILVKIFWGRSPKEFFRGEDAGWNIFDLIVTVISSLSFFTGIEGVVGARAIRILRELRLLRVVSGSNNLKRIFHALMYALPRISWTFIFFVMLYYIYGVIGVEIFGPHSDHFESLHRTFLTLLQIMTFDDWAALASGVMEVYPWAWLYFVTFIVMAAYILVNLIVGIVVDSLNEVNEQEKMEHSDIEREFAKLESQLDSVKKMVKRTTQNNDAKHDGQDQN